MSGALLPGDWRCPRCADHCFAKNSSCRKCGYSLAGFDESVGIRCKGKGRGKGKGKAKGFEHEGIVLVPVRRCFECEHPDVERLSEVECERIRTKHMVYVMQSGGERVPKPVDEIAHLPFPECLKRALLAENIHEPSPVQVQAWPAAMQGRDLVAVAETGSGKTLAYVLPLLVHAHAQPEQVPGDGPIGLVLVPTRHLCVQVARIVDSYGKRLDPNFTCLSAEQLPHEHELRCQALVATPSRFDQLWESRRTNLLRATFVVFDEADEFFRDDSDRTVTVISEIVKRLRPDRQVLLFSASWPEKVEQLADRVMQYSPLTIVAGSRDMSACKTIEQKFWKVGKVNEPGQSGQETKEALLVQKLTSLKSSLSEEFKVLIFVNRKERLSSVLALVREECGILGAESYGEEHALQSESQRDEVLRRFSSESGDCHVLVATQVLGRGLDVRSIRWVINFDLPWKIVEYVHRIGRTGRAGDRGNSLTLLEDHDLASARDLKDCLEKSEQQIPHFLREAARNWRRFQSIRYQYLAKLRGQDPQACSHNQPPPTIDTIETKALRDTSVQQPVLWECPRCFRKTCEISQLFCRDCEAAALTPKNLPPDWQVCFDASSQRHYFANAQTGESSWYPPKQSTVHQIIDVLHGSSSRDPAVLPTASPLSPSHGYCIGASIKQPTDGDMRPLMQAHTTLSIQDKEEIESMLLTGTSENGVVAWFVDDGYAASVVRAYIDEFVAAAKAERSVEPIAKVGNRMVTSEEMRTCAKPCPAPGVAAKTIAPFDGQLWRDGRDFYLTFASNTQLEILVHPDAGDGWLFGRLPCGYEGWLPQNYVEFDA